MSLNRRLCLVVITVVLSGAFAVLVSGQGGTGRETPNANAGKKPVKAKPVPGPRRISAKKQPTPEESPSPTVAESPAAIKPTETKSPETEYWNSIKDSTNPDHFNEYLRRYPGGEFAGLAKDRLSALQAAKDAAAAASPKPNAGKSQPLTPPPVEKNAAEIELVLIKPGEFMMGRIGSGFKDSKPTHRVTISYSFYIGKYEVTQAQWQAVMGNNPSSFKDCGGNCPVQNVSWDDAQRFIQKLNQMQGAYTYRLPTEAEWEYACRAGEPSEKSEDPWISAGPLAWYDSNSERKPHPVGKKEPNAWGLFDMLGNVTEWCEDWYHDSYKGAPTDGSARLIAGKEKERVRRGGSSYDSVVLVNAWVRMTSTSYTNMNDLGFRVVAVRREP